MDINEEIKNLTKNFQELVEGRKEGESTEDFKHRLAQEQTDKKYGDYVNSLKKAIYSKQHDKKHGYKDESSGSIRTKKYNVQAFQNYSKFNKASNIDLKNGGFEPNSLSREEIKDRIEDDTDQLKREMRADNNSYNSITKQILDLTEAYVNLLEAQDARGGAQKEVNKITRTKKDKNGEPIEVVSVADELFPYKGTAKEQYNQKILAKINDMIEGTATLDDLIQLVRSKKPAVNVKESLQETLDKMMAVTEALTKSAQKWYDKVMDPETTPTGGMQLKVYTPEQAMKIAQGMSQMELDKKAAIKAMPKSKESKEPKQQANQLGLFNDNNSLEETLDKMMAVAEEIILERNKENRAKKEKWELKTNHITKKEKKAVQDYAKEQGDEAKYHQIAADDYDHIYSQQPAKAPNGMRNPVADYFNGKYQEMLRNKGRNEQNIADEVEPLTKKLKNREHKFHDMVRGFHDPNLNH